MEQKVELEQQETRRLRKELESEKVDICEYKFDFI